MVFWGCSDVVESWAEHSILDAESRRNAAFTSDSEQPRRASPWRDARTSDNDSPRRAGLLIDELADLSIDQRNKSKFGRLDLLPEAKMKISHHKSTNNVVMRQRTKRVQLRDAAGVYRCS